MLLQWIQSYAPRRLVLTLIFLSFQVMFCGESKFSCEEYHPILRSQADGANRYFNRGVIFQINEQYEEAITAFEESVRLSPDDAESYFRLGMCYNLIDKNQEAAKAFSKAFALDDFKALHVDLGGAYLLLNNYEKSAEEYRLSLEHDEPHPIKSMCNLGACYINLQEYDKAISIYEKALRLNQDASVEYNVHNNLAIAYHMTGRYQDALSQYEASLRANPNDPVILYNTSLMYIKLDNTDKALVLLKTLRKYDSQKALTVERELRRVRPDVNIPDTISSKTE